MPSGLPGGFRFFLGGGDWVDLGGSTVLKIIIYIKSGTLLSNILGGSSQFLLVGGGGGETPKTGLQETLAIRPKKKKHVSLVSARVSPTRAHQYFFLLKNTK